MDTEKLILRYTACIIAGVSGNFILAYAILLINRYTNCFVDRKVYLAEAFLWGIPLVYGIVTFLCVLIILFIFRVNILSCSFKTAILRSLLLSVLSYYHAWLLLYTLGPIPWALYIRNIIVWNK